MGLSDALVGPDPWVELSVYRQRYDIEDRLEPVRSLERSISRRRSRKAGTLRRLAELESQLAKTRHELGVLDREIAGSQAAGELLIRDLLDRVRIEHGEGWTPTPIRGFRMWRIEGNTLVGSQMPWASPMFTAECLRDVHGDDIPHPVRRCGPPACGVYATKDLGMLTVPESGCPWEGHAIGVVALTGKVVEHAHGYRAAKASVVAISATARGSRLITARPGHIGLLFADPAATLQHLGQTRTRAVAKVTEFLEQWKDKEETWTSVPNYE